MAAILRWEMQASSSESLTACMSPSPSIFSMSTILMEFALKCHVFLVKCCFIKNKHPLATNVEYAGKKQQQHIAPFAPTTSIKVENGTRMRSHKTGAVLQYFYWSLVTCCVFHRSEIYYLMKTNENEVKRFYLHLVDIH